MKVRILVARVVPVLLGGALLTQGCVAGAAGGAAAYGVGKLYLGKERAAVLLMEQRAAIQDCAFVKSVESHTYWGGFALQDAALRKVLSDLTHQAADSGADTVLVQSKSKSFWGSMAKGEAYRCQRSKEAVSNLAGGPAMSPTVFLPTFRTTELTPSRLRAEFETIPGHVAESVMFLTCSAVRAATERGFRFVRMGNHVSERSGPSVGQRKGSLEIELFNVAPAGASVIGLDTPPGRESSTDVLDASSFAAWCALPTLETRDLAPTRLRAELHIRALEPSYARVFLVCSAVRLVTDRGFRFFRIQSLGWTKPDPMGLAKGSFEIELVNVPPADAAVIRADNPPTAEPPPTAVLDASSFATPCAPLPGKASR